MLPGASGHVFRRFWVRFEMDFRYFWERFLGCVFCIETRNVSAGVGTALLFGAEFSHSLGKKCALTRATHPQQPLSKGGGLAKRPQLLLPPFYHLNIRPGCVGGLIIVTNGSMNVDHGIWGPGEPPWKKMEKLEN